MELMSSIKERRTIRKFRNAPVSNDDIYDLMEAVMWAPSWANTQVWEFIIVRDRDLIRQVTDTYSENNPARECSFSADVILVACAKTMVSGYKKGKQRTQYAEWMLFDVGMAVQNLSLRAGEIGLGTVVVGSMNHERCARILQVPDDYAVICAIPVGYPDEEKPAPHRRPVASFSYLNVFGDPFIEED